MTQLETLPTAVIEDDIVKIAIVYNAFDPADAERHDMTFVPGAMLADYLGDLPTEAEWKVGVNGEPIEAEDFSTKLVEADDCITIVQVPLGDAGKAILQLVAMVAVAVAAVFVLSVAGPYAAAAFLVVASALTMLAFAPKVPKQKDQEDTASYGIDGEKNTAIENIPVPVVIGEYRVAGNLVDVYTQNVGDSQYLYMRAVINDGEIEGVYDVEINEQPAANFKDVTTRVHLGSEDQDVNDWFTNSIRLVNKGQKFNDTSVLSHVTTSNCDRVRFDIVLPQGLVNIHEKKGTFRNQSVNFTTYYRLQGTPDWKELYGESWESVPSISGTSGLIEDTGSFRVNVVADSAYGSTNQVVTASYRVPGGSWVEFGQSSVTPKEYSGYVEDYSFLGSIRNSFLQGGGVISNNRSFTATGLPVGDYEVRVVGGTFISAQRYRSNNTNHWTVTDNRTKPTRHTFECATFPEGNGIYELRINRTNNPSTDKFIIDECWLTDVGEIDINPVALRGAATISARILLTDQLSNVPGITARVKGSLLQEYDIEGNSTIKRWSQNAAWATLDTLVGAERGVGYQSKRIDWAKWYEWAQDCDTYNWKFNGVFKESSNVADTMRTLMTVGHAVPTRIGNRISVAIDKPDVPQMVFGMGSIIKDSFAVNYISMTDRANEFEVTYFDKNDRNKSKSLRIVDPLAIERGDVPKTVAIQLIGVDNAEQAQREVWRVRYANRLIQRRVSFEAPIEAIAVAVGDVALVAHDSVSWAQSGRLETGSSASVLHLDKPVTMLSGKLYGALVVFPALQLATFNVTSVMGRVINVTSAQDLDSLPIARVRSIAGDVNDFEVESITHVSGNAYSMRLKSSPISLSPGMAMAAWCVDQTFERNVTFNEGDHDTITLSEPLPAAPGIYTNWMFGERSTFKRPYRVKEISGEGVEKRALTLVEYAEGVFAEPGYWVPIPTYQISSRTVSQVSGLGIDYDRVIYGDQNVVNVRVSWNSSSVVSYAGADIYMSVNGGEFRAVGSQQLVTEFSTTASAEDVVAFRVIAFNTRGDRASYSNAPTVSATIVLEYLTLDAPTDPVYTVTYGIAEASIAMSATEPFESEPLGYQFAYQSAGSSEWITLAATDVCAATVTGLQVGDYLARVRSVRGQAISSWVTFGVSIQAPALSDQVTGLRVAGTTPGQFGGGDAIFSWDDPARSAEQQYAFRDYEVRILKLDNSIVRVEYVVDAAYTYSFAKNAADTAGAGGVVARRAFKIEVRERGRFGSLSSPALMTAQNLAPQALSVVTEQSFNFISLRITGGSDIDLAGCRVWMSTAFPVVKNAGTLVHEGPLGNVVLKASSATTYYLTIAGYDAFLDGTVGTETNFAVTTAANPASALDVDPPSLPTGLALSSTLVSGSAKLSASWTASVSTDVNGYELAVRETATGNYVTYAVGRQESGTVVRFEIQNVKRGVVYQAKVRALDHFGNASAYTSVVGTAGAIDATPPGSPTSLSTVSSFRNGWLNWINPNEDDLDYIEIWEYSGPSKPALGDVAANATLISTAAGSSFVRSGLVTDQVYWHWLRAVDTSGNKSAFVPFTVPITPIQTEQADYQNLSIVSAAIANAAIDDAKIANLSAAKLLAGTIMSGSIQIGGLGDTLATVALRASDPITRANSAGTKLLPGLVQINGSGTTLSNWIFGGDNTSINGGAIGANTVAANKLTIGLRGLTVEGFDFVATPSANRVNWTAGSITYVNDSGTTVTVSVALSEATWTSGTLYIAWQKGAGVLNASTNLPGFPPSEWVILATYKGGADLNVNLGRTIIDGDKITTGTIHADRLRTNTAFAQNLFVGGSNLALYGSYAGFGKGAIVVNNGATSLIRMGWLDGANIGFELRNSSNEIVLSHSTPASSIYNSAVTFSGLSDRPTSLSEISSTEADKLGGIAPGADVTGDNTAAFVANQAWAATNGAQSVVDNRLVGVGTNAVVDSEFARGTYAFRFATNTFAGPTLPVNGGVNLNASWFGVKDVMWANVGTFSPWDAAGLCDPFTTRGKWISGNLADQRAFGLPVKQGDKVYARCLLARHRCQTQLYLLLFDKDGNWIPEAPSWTGGRLGGGAGGIPSNFDLVGGVHTIAHPDAASAQLMWRMLSTGEADPYIFMTEPAMGILPPGQTALPPYTRGPSDPLADATNYGDARISNTRLTLSSGGQLVWTDGNNMPINLGGANLSNMGAGLMAFINQINSGNVGTFIADATIGNAKIAELSAAKITTGTLSADRIQAGTLAGEKLTIGGVDWTRLLISSMGRYVEDGYSGTAVQPTPGSTLAIPGFDPFMGGVNPSGVFTIDYSADVQPLYVNYNTTYLGLPAFHYYDDDNGGLTIGCTDAQGNNYRVFANSTVVNKAATFPILATTQFNASWTATIFNGNNDTGWVNEGDYYIRRTSQRYRVSNMSARIRWSAF